MSEPNAVSRVTRGAISELRAGVYLLERGYHVFRSESPSCPVDIVAFRPGETPIKVEVKSLNIQEAQPGRGRGLSVSWPVNGEWDLALFVASDAIHEVWAPAGYRETLDRFRAFYGFPAAPLRARRGTGKSRPLGQEQPIYAKGAEWV